MRSLLALSFLAVVAAHDCPIKGIVGWLKEHGEEMFETAIECKDIPAIIKKAQEHKECYAEKTTADKAAIALWYAITGLEHMNGTAGEFAKHSKVIEKVKSFATQKVIAMAHEGADKFCGNDNCMEQVNEVQSTISSCYASLACTFMGKIVPFGTCKDAMDKYMRSTMNLSIGSMCESDDIQGKPYYCAEINSNLMFKDVDCYMEMKTVGQGLGRCTPKCVQEWDALKGKSPKCSKLVTGLTQKIFENVKVLMEDIAKDAKIDMKKIADNMPKHLPTYDETCGTVDQAPTEEPTKATTQAPTNAPTEAKATTTCPVNYPTCYSDKNCISPGASARACTWRWCRAPSASSDPGNDYNYINGYDGSGFKCTGHYQASKSSNIIAGDVFRGHYACAQGRTSLEIHVDTWSALPTGRFKFSPSAESTDECYGEFHIRGYWEATTRSLTFSPSSWIKNPCGYSLVGLSGTVALDGNQFSGSITSGISGRAFMHGYGCGTFSTSKQTSKQVAKATYTKVPSGAQGCRSSSVWGNKQDYCCDAECSKCGPKAWCEKNTGGQSGVCRGEYQFCGELWRSDDAGDNGLPIVV